jgi:oxygen-independent coproporphyrinogen-3 oxidase
MLPLSLSPPLPLPAVTVPGLYVHVPFCFHKCHYCDFYSITRQSPERMAGFVDLVLREGDGWGERGPRICPKTVFFGGGTPSLLPIDDMRRLLAGLKERFDFSQLDEWTVECNPATVSLEYCQMLREMGVNRLSFGAQSFDPRELQILERHHEPADVGRSVEIARAAGFGRVNVDLIYAVPGQDLASWERSLEAALALQTEHISCYGLTYESNTPMAVKKRLGAIRAVEDEVELEMLHFTRNRLAEVGYHAYEISNYAKPGEECRHNLLYWNGGSYIGLGPSAASHVEGWRWKNRGHLGEWEQAVGLGGVPTAEAEHLTPQQRAGELAMLQLRLEQGVRYADFLSRTGVDAAVEYRTSIEHLSSLGLIQADVDGFCLSEKGINVADAVAGEFL